MDALPFSSGIMQSPSSQLRQSQPRANQSYFSSFFRSIPPERVGLNGEYDHSGLAKRVLRAFQQNLEPSELDSLRVTQRGTVVVVIGKNLNQSLIRRLVKLALKVEGATDIEVNGISFAGSLAACWKASISARQGT